MSTSPSIKEAERIPFWRDGRIIGILAQIAFVIFFLLAFSQIGRNLSQNLATLGEAQFICKDGSSSLRCAFDFLSSSSQFDIQETTIAYTAQDSYWRALAVGALNTLRVTMWGIILTTILGTLTGIARLSPNWLISRLTQWYVDLMRNTPLLLQLFFIYFVIFLAFPPVANASQLFNWPIYLSQRGINYPSLVFMSSFGVWLLFIILGLVQAQLLWLILGKREETTGQESNRLAWAIASFVVVVLVGWFVAGATSQSEAMIISKADRVHEFKDLIPLVERRFGVEDLADIHPESLDPDIYKANVLKVCTIQDSPSEANLTAVLRAAHIPYSVQRYDRPDQAIEGYGNGECDLFAARYEVLAAERDLLENSAAQLIVPLAEVPVRISIPRLEGFNFLGGSKLSLEFTALLIGLVLFTSAFVAEIVRAGILSVPKGQSEAAKALGLSEGQRLRLVVLPQALRVIIPPLTSQYLNLAKNSSLALAVAYPDLYRTASTVINQSGRPIQIILIMAGTYLTFSLIISAFLNWYNAKVALVER